MHASGSFIRTVLERIRFYTDDADGDAKYTNDYLVRHVIMPCTVEVITQLNLDADNPILATFSVVPESGVSNYLLPPDIQMVLQISKRDSNGNLLWDAYPRGTLNPSGPGFYFDGNTLVLKPLPISTDSFDITYIPAGGANMVLCDTGTTFARTGSGSTAVDTVTLPASPTYGTVDHRPNAYVGSIVRVLASSLWEERVCTAYNYATRTLTVRTPFTTTPSSNTSVEVCPCWCIQPLWEAVSLSGAMKFGTAKNLSGPKMAALRIQYSKAMKAIGDISSNIQAITGKYFDRNTSLSNTTGAWLAHR